MTPYFIFNGVDSRDMGVVVTSLPTVQRPQRKVTRYKVTGRDGDLEVDEGGYNGYQTTFGVNVFGQDLATIFSWLNGEGWFISSDDPSLKMWVVLDAQIKGTRFNVNGASYDTLTVTGYFHPFRYAVDDYTTEYTTFPILLTNPSAIESRPKLTIEGSGDILVTVNALQMAFVGLTDGIIVDSELMDCMNLEQTALMNQYATMDDFPTLQPGGNTISVDGTVTKITIDPRWRVL